MKQEIWLSRQLNWHRFMRIVGFPATSHSNEYAS